MFKARSRTVAFAFALSFLLPLVIVMMPAAAAYFTGRVPEGDALHQYLPYKSLAREAFRTGEAPLWNPYVFAGMPLLADPQNSLLYPAHLLFLVLPLPIAFLADLFAHVVWAAIGTFLLLRLVCTPRAALTGALAFTLCANVMIRVHMADYAIVQVMTWIPWWFLCAEQLLRTRRAIWGLALGVTFALGGLAGFPSVWAYCGVVIAARLIAGLFGFARRREWRNVKVVGLYSVGAGVLAVLISAAQWMPTLELIQHAGRRQPSQWFVAANSLEWIHLTMLVFPEIFGSPLTATSILGANWYGQQIYVGVFPFILGILFIVAAGPGRSRLATIYALLALSSLLIALGLNNPVYGTLHKLIPGVQQLADINRWTIPYCFLAAAVFAMSLDWGAAVLPSASPRFRRAALALIFGSAALALLATLILTVGRDAVDRVATPFISRMYGSGAGEKIAKLDALYDTQSLTLVNFSVVALASGGLIALRMRNRITPSLFLLAAFGLTVADLGLLALRMGLAQRWADVPRESVVAKVVNASVDLSRVLPLNAMEFTNTGSLHQVRSATGYNPLIPQRYLDFLGVLRGRPVDPVDRVPMVDRFEPRLARLLNVSHVVEYETPAYVNTGDLVATDGHGDVYARPELRSAPAYLFDRVECVAGQSEARSRLAEPEFDPFMVLLVEGCLTDSAAASKSADLTAAARAPQAVEIVSTGFNHMHLRTNSPAPGWLWLSQGHYPGWRAWVNGVPAQVHPAHLAFMALYVPAGEQVIRLQFDSPSVRAGLLTSALGVSLAAVATLFLLLRTLRLRRTRVYGRGKTISLEFPVR
jgi:hypothetical protein